MLSRFELSDDDRKRVRGLLFEIARDETNLDERIFLDKSALFAHELPSSIRKAIYDFKLREAADALLIANNPVLPDDIGPTPASYSVHALNIGELLHGLYASLLGEPFGFETQQNGKVFNDLISIPGSRDNASSGAGKVGLHTEDCVQPFMPDYLGLMCLRNEQHATTLLSSLAGVDIPQKVSDALFEERFPLRNGSTKMAILFGDPAHPYLRLGALNYQECDQDVLHAFRFVLDALEDNQQEIILRQGDCLYIDNFIAVHGRSPFQAEYGDRGRWFSRLVMLRDLRRSRAFRISPEARIMLRHRYQAPSPKLL
jgi:L-asparagine oxygenase